MFLKLVEYLEKPIDFKGKRIKIYQVLKQKCYIKKDGINKNGLKNIILILWKG